MSILFIPIHIKFYNFVSQFFKTRYPEHIMRSLRAAGGWYTEAAASD